LNTAIADSQDFLLNWRFVPFTAAASENITH
jgi:hypothetical protein